MIDKHGYGAAFVNIFDQSGRDVTPQGISRFVYIHSEKSDDASEIVIDNNERDLADRQEFQEGRRLVLLWGYIGGETQRRVVYIGETSTHYTSTVQFKILAYDKAAYLKNNAKSKVHTNKTLPELAEEIAKENGLNFINLTEDSEGNIDANGIQYDHGTLPTDINKDGYFQTGREHTANPTGILFKKKIQIPQGNKSDFRLLTDEANTQVGGPLLVEGRDDSLILKKRNFNQRPLRTYNYRNEDGQLLDFVPETKKRQKDPQSTETNVSIWDELKKEYRTFNASESTDGQTRLGDNVTFNAEERTLTYTAPSGDSINKIPVSNYQQEEKPNVGVKFTRQYNQVNLQSFKNTPVDNTAIVAIGYDFNVQNNKEESVAPPSDPLLADDDAQAQAENLRRQAALEANPANAKVLGWPKLESGKLLTILGVAKKYTGNYYITKVEHIIDYSSGYICELDLVRNATSNIPGVTAPNKANVQQQDKPVNKLVGIKTNQDTKEVEVRSIDYYLTQEPEVRPTIVSKLDSKKTFINKDAIPTAEEHVGAPDNIFDNFMSR
jgi:phage protein D